MDSYIEEQVAKATTASATTTTGTNENGDSLSNDEKPQAEASKDETAADTSPLPTNSSTDDVSLSSSTDDEDEDEEMDTGSGEDEKNNNDEDVLVRAALLKEEGNALFQKQEFDQAARIYRKGVNRLKKVAGPDADPQVTSLQLTLQTNLSMCLFNQQKYRASRDVAGQALQLDPNHVKALYRRAVACRKMGDLDQAKVDLRQALQVDSTSVACKKELAAVKKQLEQSTQQQKKALAKAFSSSTSLYEDKEKEERQKQQEKERQKKEKEKQRQERKQQWEDECVKRMASGGEAISFDDWEKEQDEMEKKKREKEEAERKKQREAERAAKKAAKQAQKEQQADEDDSDDELTEQELASLRGYKKTKDGRTTSYFSRELSEAERQNLGDMAPKKLGSSTGEAPSPLTTSAASLDASTASRPSAWNAAGTWEEKDCTTWCMESLTKRLETTMSTTESTLVVTISKVDEMTGEGSVATTGGKKRYIFDFHAKLSYKISRVDNANDGKKDTLAKGVLRLPDICSTHVGNELEVTFDSSWSKEPPASDVQSCINVRSQLVNDLKSSVQQWVQEFNEQF